MATPPILPPKTCRSNSFKLIRKPSEDQRRSSEGLHTSLQKFRQHPASFMNPLYFQVERDSPLEPKEHATKSLSYDNDTDSIYFLEKNKPALTPVSHNSDPAKNKPTERIAKGSEHEYELCDVDSDSITPHKKIADIFELVSFKSPLYGTVVPSELLSSGNLQLYDTPSSLPPPYPPPPLPEELPDIPNTKDDDHSASPPILPKRSVPPKLSHFVREGREHQLECPSTGNTDKQGLKNLDNSRTALDIVDPVLRKIIPGVQMCGYLFKVGNNIRDLSKRWFALEGPVFCCYLNDKCEFPVEAVRVNEICGVMSILSLAGQTVGDASPELWFFTVYTNSGKHLRLAARLPSDRSDWLQLLTIAISSPAKFIGSELSSVVCSGFLHLKEGIAGQWHKAFVILHGRQLKFWIEDDSKNFNLQKASAVCKESSRLSSSLVKEAGPVFHIDSPERTLYLQSDWALCTETWWSSIQQAWLVPSQPTLLDEYLTVNNVPVIISKCLKFVSTFGTTVEGIYRLAGFSSKIRVLLHDLKENAWNVHLKEEEYNAHDVASVLKRYLRMLPECLMTEGLYNMWVAASGIEKQEDRLKQIKHLLSHLPEVNYQSLKCLMEHLCIIAEHSSQNRMPALNLAPVFGPTLLFRSMDGENYGHTTAASDIVADMITFYSQLFEVEATVLEKERHIQQALQKLKDVKLYQKPAAGEILVGIYVYSKDWGRCLNIKLNPTTTSVDICAYAISIRSVREGVDKLAVYEVVCNGDLERPLHYSEPVLQVALKWMSWDSQDAKDNYLCIKHNALCDAISSYSMVMKPLSVFGEFKFAERGSKVFKKVQFQFTAAKLKCFKLVKFFNQESQQDVGEWKIEEITWYIGVDNKRSSPTRWSLTFVERDVPVKRSKNNPYFGRAVCCNNEEEFFRLIAAMLTAEHPEGLLPKRSLPDLLT